MSVVTEERNTLTKRFARQAVIPIDDALYSVENLKPNSKNHRLFPVHVDAVERLNFTMQRHISGNAQIFVTMVYKDVPREDLIKKWWSGLKQLPEFANLPSELQNLELEQARKISPTSRYSIKRLYEAFVSHVDEEAKVKNEHLTEFKEAAAYFEDYIVECVEEVRRTIPAEFEKVSALVHDQAIVAASLPNDTAGSDPLFIAANKSIKGVRASDLYRKLVPTVKDGLRDGKSVYYEMFIRVQNKGNNLIDENGNIVDSSDPWQEEKNRVVQGDSRTWQILLKPLSAVITKLPKLVSALFAGWLDQEQKNIVIGNSMKHFYGKYLFDSFDASEFDALTDPQNFALGLEIIWNVFKRIFPDVHLGYTFEDMLNHYLHDPTLTPWGAFERDSTPSGHQLTGPNGTITNMLRAYVQTFRLLLHSMKWSFNDYNKYLHTMDKKRIALFNAVGDDAFQLRALGRDSSSIAEENNSDGFKNNADKIVLSDKYIHFLQHAFYYDGKQEFFGFYPVSRVVEHGLFQEHANEYTGEEVSTQALVQNINNARNNPLQDYLIEFFYIGDEKYHLGADVGVINLFKAAAAGRSVAEFLDREWDPSYADMSWEKYSEVLQGTIRKIESKGRKSEVKK